MMRKLSLAETKYRLKKENKKHMNGELWVSVYRYWYRADSIKATI